jgi:hypothetical protein
MTEGTVKFFNSTKGYGFIALITAGAFVHISAVELRACRPTRARRSATSCRPAATARCHRHLKALPLMPTFCWACGPFAFPGRHFV